MKCYHCGGKIAEIDNRWYRILGRIVELMIVLQAGADWEERYRETVIECEKCKQTRKEIEEEEKKKWKQEKRESEQRRHRMVKKDRKAYFEAIK